MSRIMVQVKTAWMRSGRGSILGPDTRRRVRWWECKLACGHVVEVMVRYVEQKVPGPRLGGWCARSRSDAKPAPKKCHCKTCEKAVKPAATGG